MSRLHQIVGEAFDLAIVGGGIIGCGIARDAALRGLRVALFEKRDFGGGTTSASTRIVHGGLRYLEMLDFRLVRLDLRERETLLRIAPHLVKPLEFLIPFFDSSLVRRLKMRLGLQLYDALRTKSGTSLPSHRMLTAGEARRADPALDRPGLQGAAAYYDARVDSPERLCIENLVEAVEHGARVFNYAEVTSAITKAGAVAGVRVRDTLDGAEADIEINARVVVNASGPWFERVARSLAGEPPGRIRTTKGIHIVCPPLNERAMVLFSRVDRRLLFAIPRLEQTWIGTTDTDFAGDPFDASATREDVDYLIASVRDIFPSLTIKDVLYTTAGVRALVRQEGHASSVSRMHRIVDGERVGSPGLVSVLGGKITGYRSIAEDATDAVCRVLRVERRATTAETPLPGARTGPAPSASLGTGPSTSLGAGPGPTGQEERPLDLARGRPLDLARGRRLAHLYDLYGSRAADVIALTRLSPELEQPLSPRYPDIGAQVVFSVRFEHSLKLGDFLRRRTVLGATADQGLDAALPAARLMAEELGWSAQRMAAQVDEYFADVAGTRRFQG